MNLAAKFKETALSVFPVMAIVLLLGAFAVPLGARMLLRFSLGGACLVAGLTVFLLGVDVGIRPLGEMCGAALMRKRSLALFLSVAAVVGFVVTIAEPDIQVFSRQVAAAIPSIGKTPLVVSIAAGVGLFMAVGVARAILALPIKMVLAVSYAVLLVLALLAPANVVAIAFDSGGATTGPMTVPFILALGLGVSAVRDDGDGGFGLTGVASVGPVLAVLAYSLVSRGGGAAPSAAGEAAATHSVLAEAFTDAFLSVAPLLALFLVFRVFLLDITMRQTVRIVIGFAYAYVGLSVFLFGINCGFMECGMALGSALGAKALGGGVFWWIVLMVAGTAFGAAVVCAEPAVWTLCDQVEEATRGAVRRRAILVFLAGGTALAICLAILRSLLGFGIGWLLIPGYVAAFALTIFTPRLFAGMAFDSGGVASGPLTSTFILSFALGAGGGTGDSFGVIALVAMMPLVAIQAMGIAYERRRRAAMAARIPAQGEGK